MHLIKIEKPRQLFIKTQNPLLEKKANCLFNIERLISIKSILKKILDIKLEHWGLLGNSDLKIFVEIQRVKWSIDCFFDNTWEQMLNDFLSEFYENVKNKFSKKRKKFKKSLENLKFKKIDDLVTYSEELRGILSYYDLKTAELFQNFTVEKSEETSVHGQLNKIILNDRQKISKIEKKFIDFNLEGLEPLIIQYLEFTKLRHFRGLFSKQTLNFLVNTIFDSPFCLFLKEQMAKYFIDESNKADKKFKSHFNMEFSIKEYIGKNVYLFHILVKQKESEKCAKSYLNLFYQAKELLIYLSSELFPFLNHTRLPRILLQKIMDVQYKLITQKKCLVPFDNPDAARERQNIKNIDEELDLQHDYILERSVSSTSTLFISGYLSKDSSSTKKTWIKLEDFFDSGNLISVDWNSTSFWNVFTEVLSMGAGIVSSFIIPGRPLRFLSIFSNIKDCISKQKNLFTDTYKRAIKEGKVSYDIMKNNPFECDRAISLVSFSLGTVYVYSFLTEVVKEKADPLIIKDVFLMGGCVSQDQLEEVLAELLVEGSSLKGKVYIIHSHRDLVLKYFFSYAYSDKTPIGIEGFNHLKCCENFLKKGVFVFDSSKILDSKKSEKQLMLDYLKEKVINIDATYIAGFHTKYRSRLDDIFKKINSIRNY